MTRSIISLSTLTALLIATSQPQADACGTRYRRPSYAAPPTVRVVRSVAVVPPTALVRPTVAAVPAAAARELPTVPAGSQLTLPANFLGPQPGSVLMVFSDIKLPVQVDRWDTTGVTITLPPMAIKDAVVIRVDVVLPNGKLGHTQALRVTAPAPVVLHPVSPAPPLPTQPTIAASRQQAMGAGPQVAQGAAGAPIILPAATSASAAAAVPQAGNSSGVALPMQGNGTPDRPFVLPAAQPMNAASAAAPQATAAAVLDVPTADAVDDDAWLENNPILQEGVPTDPSVIPPADVTSPMSDPELGDAVQPSAPISARGVTTALSIFAQILLSK